MAARRSSTICCASCGRGFCRRRAASSAPATALGSWRSSTSASRARRSRSAGARRRRGYVVTCELPYSRAFAGTLVFSKEFPAIAFGMSRCLARLGALPAKLVWDREGAIAPQGHPTEQFLAFCGQLALGWVILDAGDWPGQGRAGAQPPLPARQLRGRPALREPARLPAPTRRMVRSHQRAGAPDHARGRRRTPRRRARRDARAAGADARQRPAVGDARARRSPICVLIATITRWTRAWSAAASRCASRRARSPRSRWTVANSPAATRACSPVAWRSPTLLTRPRWSGCAASAERAAMSTSSCARSPATTQLIPA